MRKRHTNGLGKALVGLDFPRPNETTGPDYTFRVWTRDGGTPEVQVDDGEWIPCRSAGGYWWLDWHADRPGQHRAVVRLPRAEGPTVCRARRFEVAAS